MNKCYHTENTHFPIYLGHQLCESAFDTAEDSGRWISALGNSNDMDCEDEAVIAGYAVTINDFYLPGDNDASEDSHQSIYSVNPHFQSDKTFSILDE